MGISVGIDVGGTFTDFFCSEDGSVRLCKTPTTHYDLSVGFMKGLSELAGLSGRALDAFLSQVDSVRYSTTVGTNALIERKGPKLGLITTAGFEDTIFIGRSRSWADGASVHEGRDLARIRKPEPLISPDMVVGVRERIDYAGEVIAPLKRDDVLDKLQRLVDRGAMGFVVCLLWSPANPAHERMVRDIIEDEYPEDYLGAMPVFLSSEISPKTGEYTRFMTTIVNAYIHGIMADQLYRLDNELRQSRFSRPLVLVHNTGGTKKISRSRAVLTHNAGPVAGLQGAADLGAVLGEDNIIFTDMGGTSFDIGVITGGEVRTQDFIPVIDRWRTNIPAIEVKSIGAGGGSIAWINESFGRALEVGPASAGSMPGPACYDQGGDEPTVTDADLVLGYTNPDNYLGGKLLLDPDLASEAIEEKIARPLGLDVREAALRIRRLVDARMGQEVFNEVALKGHDPRKFVLFACGGAGAAHACGYAPYIGVSKIIVPGCASVFGAFGASNMQIREVWEKTRAMKIFRWSDQSYSTDTDGFNAVVAELRDLAVRDLRLEGFAEEQIRFDLDLDMRFGSQYNLTKIRAPRLTLQGPEDFEQLSRLFIEQYSKIYSPEATYPSGGINIECFYLTASIEQPALPLRPEALAGPEPAARAKVGTRHCYWSVEDGERETPVYSFPGLMPGNRIAGPAIIESPETTFVVPAGWRFEMDAFRNGIMTRPADPA